MTFKELKDVDLSIFSEEIKPLRSGHLASEYNSLIADYSKSKIAVTDRIIEPYLSTNTHGQNCYDMLLDYLKNRKFKNVLDVGCGAGELLNKISETCGIPKDNLFGISIHTGEVKYAKDKFGLNNVIPGDMRNLLEIFNNFKFDFIIFHCCLQFISEDERINCFKQAAKLLNRSGEIIEIDYKNEECSRFPRYAIPKNHFVYEKAGDSSYQSLGNLTTFRYKDNDIEGWMKENKNKHFYAELPDTFNEYYKQIKTPCRTEQRKAQKLNYLIERLDKLNELEEKEIIDIFLSKSERQGRPINTMMEWGCNLIDIRTYGWPEINFTKFNNILKFYVVKIDSKIVGYCQCFVSGTDLVVHSIMGHGDHLRNGIMKHLILEIIKDNIPQIKRFYYGIKHSKYKNIQFFLKDFLITK